MDKKTIKVTKTFDTEVYITEDFHHNEVVCEYEDTAKALEEAVSKARQARNWICNSIERQYVIPKNIKKGDLVKVEAYRLDSTNHDELVDVQYGIYEGIEIEKFENDNPKFLIRLSMNWNYGSRIASRTYPYNWVPHFRSVHWCLFTEANVDPSEKRKFEITKVSKEEREEYNNALAAYNHEKNIE